MADPLRAGAALPLSGRYARPAGDAAAGLSAWAGAAGVTLEILDCGEEPASAGRMAGDLAGRVDLLFGPYGSGAARAAAEALAGRPEVMWNHGGAAVPAGAARVVSVLGPAERYWAGVADVLRSLEVDLSRVAILRAESGFGRAVAEGAVASIRSAGARPLTVSTLTAEAAVEAAETAL